MVDKLAQHPDAILTYDDDAVIDDPGRPIHVVRKQLTGRLLRIDAAQLLYLVSRAIFPSCLPRMLNCVLPRQIINNVTEKFGGVFGVVAPDHCCAYRCLAVVDSLYHYDEAVLVQYGQRHSTGTGLFKRQLNEAAADFKANSDPAGLTWAAPIPEIETNINVVFHEYCLAKSQSNSPKFPEVDRTRYFEAIVNELSLLEDDARRTRFEKILRAHGWQATVPAATTQETTPRNFSSQTVVPLWTRLQTLFGRRPPEDDDRLIFRNLEDALWFSDRFPKTTRRRYAPFRLPSTRLEITGLTGGCAWSCIDAPGELASLSYLMRCSQLSLPSGYRAARFSNRRYTGESFMPFPRISIVIPTRDRPGTLGFALRTCLDQDFEDFEVVVSDNCSPPATREVVESFADRRIKYVAPLRRWP